MESTLFGRATNALRKNPYRDFSQFIHEAHEGRVVLKGIVSSYFEKQMVQESLRPIEGIFEIINELEVMMRPYRVDETQ